MIYHFPECPNCKGPWVAEDHYRDCYECQLIWHPTTLLEYVSKTVTQNLHVYWTAAGDCRVDIFTRYEYEYGKTSGLVGVSSKTVEMPYLPYDITEEQLKLYMTFI